LRIIHSFILCWSLSTSTHIMEAMPSTNTKVEASHVLESPDGEGQPHADTGPSATIEPSLQPTSVEPDPAISVSNFGHIVTFVPGWWLSAACIGCRWLRLFGHFWVSGVTVTLHYRSRCWITGPGDRSTLTASLASSITRYRQENGRSYHSYREGSPFSFPTFHICKTCSSSPASDKLITVDDRI